MGAWPLSPGHAPPFFDLAALARLSPRLPPLDCYASAAAGRSAARSLLVLISLRSPRLPPRRSTAPSPRPLTTPRARSLLVLISLRSPRLPPFSPAARMLRLRGRWPLRLRARFRFRSRCARLASHLPTRRSTAPSPRPLAATPARSLSVSMSLRSPRLPPPHPALECSVSRGRWPLRLRARSWF